MILEVGRQRLGLQWYLKAGLFHLI